MNRNLEAGFIPLDDSAKDGERQLVSGAADLAAAHWTGDMWAYPREGGHCWVQIDFEPTHYLPRKPR